MTIYFTVTKCFLGHTLVAKSTQGICAIFFGDDSAVLIQDLKRRFPGANLINNDHGFSQEIKQVMRLIDTPAANIELPLDIRGTAFQQRVWQALREIPSGTTTSYTDIAKRIGAPKAVRAVAQACGANPIAVVIPCHRVVRQDGALSGYRWGIERKQQLLQREMRQ